MFSIFYAKHEPVLSFSAARSRNTPSIRSCLARTDQPADYPEHKHTTTNRGVNNNPSLANVLALPKTLYDEGGLMFRSYSAILNRKSESASERARQSRVCFVIMEKPKSKYANMRTVNHDSKL